MEINEVQRKQEARYLELLEFENKTKSLAKNKDGTLKPLNYPLPKEFKKYSQQEKDYFVERYNQELEKITKVLPKFEKEKIKECYEKIIQILKKYMDCEEQDYSLIAVWIIGTYFHKQFSSYPYLYFNATKGSGKTRLMKIIANLSKNGKLVGSMTEAVLFRKAKERTLCIDELENLNAKGSENLKLLLNSAYKKGLSVERMVKRKSASGESQEVEEFEVYCPIAIANIWGLDNTLRDRCISIILEKSSKIQVTKLIELFEKDIDFQQVRDVLNNLTSGFDDDLNLFGNIFEKWNNYVQNQNVVNEVSIVSKVNVINVVSNKGNIADIDYIADIEDTFQNLSDTNLSGRDLELFFPMFIIAKMISEDVLRELMETAQQVTKQRKNTDREENTDVRLIEFIAQSDYNGYVDVSKVVYDLKDLFGEEKWINSRGISRALNRLKLILDRRSTGKNKQIKINVLKAQEKLLMYKEPDISITKDSEVILIKPEDFGR